MLAVTLACSRAARCPAELRQDHFEGWRAATERAAIRFGAFDVVDDTADGVPILEEVNYDSMPPSLPRAQVKHDRRAVGNPDLLLGWTEQFESGGLEANQDLAGLPET